MTIQELEDAMRKLAEKHRAPIEVYLNRIMSTGEIGRFVVAWSEMRTHGDKSMTLGSGDTIEEAVNAALAK